MNLSRRNFLKATAAALTTLSLNSCVQSATPNRRPNIIFILIDDMGWKDVGYAGSRYYQTPNIDALAAQSMRLMNAYSSSPVCSPSRGAIFSGKNPARTQLTTVWSGDRDGDQLFTTSKSRDGRAANQMYEAMHRHALPRKEKLFSEVFQDAGYRTAYFGKWHCGLGEGYRPSDRGFHLVKGARRKHQPTRGHYIRSFAGNLIGLDNYSPDDYVSQVLTKECVKFIRENKDKPFLAVLSHYLVHNPIKDQGLPDKVERYKKRTPDDQNNPEYAACVESVDDSIGQVMKTLKTLRIEDDTIIIFTSDNGGLTPKNTSNYPLMGGKSFPFEAGTKVPFTICWPSRIKPGISKERIIGMDIYPTMLDLAGIKPIPEQHADGISLRPILQGASSLPTRPLIFHFPHYTHAASPYSAIIHDNWKLIRFYNDEAGAYLLYNLADDPEEQYDLSEKRTEKRSSLEKLLDAQLKEMDAEMPTKNPDYDPADQRRKNRKTSLDLAVRERKEFEKRRATGK